MWEDGIKGGFWILFGFGDFFGFFSFDARRLLLQALAENTLYNR